MEKVLRLNLAGTPTSWLTREEAATLYVKELVLWEVGDRNLVVLGGNNRCTGQQSSVAMSPVIATKGNVGKLREARCFSNRMLFRRDNHQCMYCGQHFEYSQLTRDHIMPSSRGGPDTWENVVAACKRCNQHKADKTPEEAGMELLAVPFKPNVYESMYLAQHRILEDQMDYLAKQFSGLRHWQAA